MKGYLFYLYLLGVSYLSGIKEYSDILKNNISEFHSVIDNNITKEFEYNLISDSIFLYAKNCNDSINSFFIVANIFRELIKKGILCRAGCDYGEFDILPTGLSGKNIYGEAATKCVKLEKLGKGHRIFVGKEAYVRFNSKFKKIFESIGKSCENSLITKHINHVDYSELYIFNWAYINNNVFMNNKSFYKFNNCITKLDTDNTIINDNYNILKFIENENNISHYIYTSVDKNEESKDGKNIINITKKYIENCIKYMT